MSWYDLGGGGRRSRDSNSCNPKSWAGISSRELPFVLVFSTTRVVHFFDNSADSIARSEVPILCIVGAEGLLGQSTPNHRNSIPPLLRHRIRNHSPLRATGFVGDPSSDHHYRQGRNIRIATTNGLDESTDRELWLVVGFASRFCKRRRQHHCCCNLAHRRRNYVIHSDRDDLSLVLVLQGLVRIPS